MGKYCCFICPKKDYSEKEIADRCPDCGKPYGFPLDQHPQQIRSYHIVKPLRRGFYSVTYLVESGPLRRQNILKVIPKKVYTFFKKDFIEDCKIHHDLAQESDHITSIYDYFEENIAFGDAILDCWISVLDYIPGETLRDYLSSPSPKRARDLAQIAIDLFRILSELDTKLKRHNDFHGDNFIVKHLEKGKRADAIADNLKVYLIDLGSVADFSKSDGEQRLGDRHWVAYHLQTIVMQLLQKHDELNPIDYRLAMVLAQHVKWLFPPDLSTRHLSPEEAIDQIRMGMSLVASPWRETKKTLSRLSDTYNAQSLDPWFIPSLIVDPEGQWEKMISTHGPQIITGMRGCGKTLFLKSLHFHARAAKREYEDDDMAIKRILTDDYVGLYVSAASLLTQPAGIVEEPRLPFERLLVLYVKDAIYALRHLGEIDRSQITPAYYRNLADLIIECLGGPEYLRQVKSDYDLELNLQRLIFDLESPDVTFSISNPIDVFVRCSDVIRAQASCWYNSQVLYLLDDLSTRYLPLESIGKLVSTLLYQKPNSSFKITTERQTYEEILHSPGLIERARTGRDYEVFDLGAEVYKSTRRSRNKKKKHLIEEILEKRIKYYPGHPQFSPAALLGDRSHAYIARLIAKAPANSRILKSVYSGISTLSKICVGDIGDVILLYEEILRQAVGHTPPIPPEIQTNAILTISSNRLWRLDRQDSNIKNHAKSFADAAHALLVNSYKNRDPKKKERLRQYYGIYVRMTASNTLRQFKKLRELIDAGVFVFHGGAPRTKTRDGDPSLQFKLTYRKLFGLGTFIGLADRDRFELSGKDLEDWLDHPENGKEILMRHLVRECKEDEDEDEEEIENYEEENIAEEDQLAVSSKVSPNNAEIPLLPYSEHEIKDFFSNGFTKTSIDIVLPQISIISVPLASLGELPIRSVVVGLGFEDRTLESASRLFSRVRATSSILVRYSEPGKANEIRKAAEKASDRLIEIQYRDIIADNFILPNGRLLVDVTGMAKPAIFRILRRTLIRDRVVWVLRTQARLYYPRDEAVKDVINKKGGRNRYEMLKAADSIIMGEKGPYKLINLFSSREGDERRRVICAFASPKHERLLHLLDSRKFDRAEIISHPPSTPRGKLARIVADIARDDYLGSSVTEIKSDDLKGAIEYLFDRYKYWFIERGFGFEIGLTGSKIQTIACTVASATLKFSNIWYVAPQEFDPDRFTQGVGQTSLFEIKLVDTHG